MVKTAIILAGGLGTRLRSVVQDVPKPMAPIRGRPFLAYQLDYWIAQGIERFILSIGYKYQTVIDFFAHHYHGAVIDYVIEESPLGTGGGFLLALNQLNSHEPCLLLNGDTYFNVDLKRLHRFSMEHQADWTFSLFSTNDPKRYMGIDLAEDGQIRSFRSEIQSTKSRLANGGVYWFNPETIPAEWRALNHSISEIAHSVPTSRGLTAGSSDVSRSVDPAVKPREDGYEEKPEQVPMSLEVDLFGRLLTAQHRLLGLEHTGVFIDIGVPEDYYRSAELL